MEVMNHYTQISGKTLNEIVAQTYEQKSHLLFWIAMLTHYENSNSCHSLNIEALHEIAGITRETRLELIKNLATDLLEGLKQKSIDVGDRSHIIAEVSISNK